MRLRRAPLTWNKLITVVGFDRAWQLAAYAGQRIPRPPASFHMERAVRIIAAVDDGESYGVIARREGLTRARICQIAKSFTLSD